MNLGTNDDASKPNDIDKAKLEVARAERALHAGVHEVTLVGKAGMEQALSVLKPALVTAVVVGGVIWIVSAVRKPRHITFERASASTQKSIVREVLRTLVLTVASAGARRIAESLVSDKEDQSIPARQSTPPHEVSAR
ncbi:MAG TPA: hypothetical protein VNN72_23265 [Polyangiaceae bacterium]|nr:hypothetical protein [Polyangiaceae bacterium]